MTLINATFVETAARLMARTSRNTQDDHDRNVDAGTYLVIPYFPNDVGRPANERPLGPGVVSWLCPSIVVNDVPGENNFKRGEETRVTVDIGNYGAGTLTAPVYLKVWWSDPSAGFTTLNLFGQTTLAIPNGTVRRSMELVGVIPTSAPAHVCLLAQVWSPLDVGGSPLPDPMNDRHWAQLNINDLNVDAGQTIQFMFWVGNPSTQADEWEVSVANVSEETHEVVQRMRRSSHTPSAIHELHLHDPRDLEAAVATFLRSRSTVVLKLAGGERRPLVLTGRAPDAFARGSMAMLEITSAPARRGQPHTGSIGLIIQPRH